MLSPRRTRRAAALSLAGLFASALVAAWCHKAHVVHGFCSDHGQPIHLEETPGHAHRLHPRTAVDRDHHVHGAHGCVALDLLTSWATTAAADRDVVDRTPSTALLLPREGALSPSIPLLLEAPKLPPPAA
jgi:hypothetical protein